VLLWCEASKIGLPKGRWSVHLGGVDRGLGVVVHCDRG
jgi:hypothetical protein